MKKIIFLLCFVLALHLSSSGVGAASPAIIQDTTPITYTDDVVSFSSQLTLQQDSTLTINETIGYETTLQKHGIYRYIPYRYEINGKHITTKITDVEVKDTENKSIPYEKSYVKNSLMLKIGDKDVTFSGKKVYRISYTVHNALLLDGESPQLVWDIVGEGWQIPVHKVHASFSSLHAKILDARCKSGSFGGDDGKCIVDQAGDLVLSLTYNGGISYGENVTLDATLSPENSLMLPTKTQQMVTLILDNVWILLFIVPTAYSLYIWNRSGRDLEYVRYNIFDDSDREVRKKPLYSHALIPLVYEPLKISPGMAGAMLDEKYDGIDLTADIIDLARQKFISITQIKEKSWISSADYEFKHLRKHPGSLPHYQAVLLSELFATGDTVNLSDLKKKFYTSFEKVKGELFQELTQQAYFTGSPAHARLKTAINVIGITLVLFGALYVTDRLPISTDMMILVLAPIGFLAAFISIFCIANMVQKSAKGTNAMLQAKGLQDTIKRGAWREKIMEKHLFFEDMLPFAIALGVVDQLSKEMKGLEVEPPSYMHGVNTASLYSAGFYNGFASDVTSSMTVSPSSSSGCGGGSGGGGGGGGGGSW